MARRCRCRCGRPLNPFIPGNLSARDRPGLLVVALVAALAVAALLFAKSHDWLGFATAAITTLVLGYALWALVGDLTAHRGRPDDLLQTALRSFSVSAPSLAQRNP